MPKSFIVYEYNGFTVEQQSGSLEVIVSNGHRAGIAYLKPEWTIAYCIEYIKAFVDGVASASISKGKIKKDA